MDELDDLASWYEKLPGASGFKWLEVVHIDDNRELAFAYSLRFDQFALAELSAVTQKPRVIRIAEDTDELMDALIDFANGDIPRDRPVKLRVKADRAGFTTYSRVRIGSYEYLGFGRSKKEDALVHCTRTESHIIPIAAKYDTEELQDALFRFATGDYPDLNAFLEAYNRSNNPPDSSTPLGISPYRNLGLPTSRDFD